MSTINHQNFIIMHKDKKVASIRKDGSCTIYCARFMPFDLYLEPCDANDFDTKLNNITNFYYWCSKRLITLDRKYAKEILNYLRETPPLNDQDRAKIALSYHALSLMDSYWVRLQKEKITYEEINLRAHSLSNAFADIALLGKAFTANNKELNHLDVAHDLSTAGIAPKAWIRKQDGFHLLKDGDKRDVDAELLASQIVRCFHVNQVRYEKGLYDGKEVSDSKIITSEKIEIQSMDAVEIYAANHDTTCEKLALKYDAYSYYMMNIIDYLVGNIDRHKGNWGLELDSDTNQILSLYPLMDFNKSFLAYDRIEGTKCLTSDKAMTQMEAAEEAVKKIGLNQIKEIDDALFPNDNIKEMFYQRLDHLKQIQTKGKFSSGINPEENFRFQ